MTETKSSGVSGSVFDGLDVEFVKHPKLLCSKDGIFRTDYNIPIEEWIRKSDAERRVSEKVTELRRTVLEKLTYVGSELEDYNDETDVSSRRFKEEVEAMIDTLKSIRQDINDFGCEKPMKETSCCNPIKSSVVGSQNLKDDERAETFLKSLGHGKGKSEEE